MRDCRQVPDIAMSCAIRAALRERREQPACWQPFATPEDLPHGNLAESGIRFLPNRPSTQRTRGGMLAGPGRFVGAEPPFARPTAAPRNPHQAATLCIQSL